MVASPLRYPGGKSKLYPYFSHLISHNALFEKDYCEPYAGGAGLAIRLLSDGYVRSVHLNDVDPAIYAFWRAVFFQNDELCKLIEDADVNIDEWHRQLETWKSCDRSDYLTLGFATFFLNRTNRSGIIDGAGPIGGYKQSGEWKIDVRFVREKQLRNIRALSRYASSVNLYIMDALDFLDETFRNPESITYLDPPYYVKGKKLYTNYYSDEDHVQIKQKVAAHQDANWVVSYDDCSRIREIYADFSAISYRLNYSAGEKSQGSEVIYLSDAIQSPRIKGFEIAA